MGMIFTHGIANDNKVIFSVRLVRTVVQFANAATFYRLEPAPTSAAFSDGHA